MKLQKNQWIEKIKETIDTVQDELISLSHDIHNNPELGFFETYAVKKQIEFLQKYGYTTTASYCELDTSYRATIGSGGYPKVAIMAEYDALPDLGHACGHNIIATAAMAAAVGMSAVIEEIGGTVEVIGCPAEENGAGKSILVERGAFDAIDCAMMIHPSDHNEILRKGLASMNLGVEFRGKSAHSGSPQNGINALTAFCLFSHNIDAMRQVWLDGTRFNMVLTEGGKASNVITEKARVKLTVRTKTRKYLLQVIEDIKRCANAAAIVVKGTCEVKEGPLYAERYSNSVLAELWKSHMEEQGEEVEYYNPNLTVGSTDFGNVSLVVPAIHEFIGISERGVRPHSKEFCQAAISERADKAISIAGKALALTALDYFCDEDIRKTVKAEWEREVLPLQ